MNRESESLWNRPWIGPAIVAAAALAMLVWTWQTWPDVLIDFGVQLYVPWRLAAGEVLYRDIAHYTGPLSVYYHAIFFRIFGPSLRVLEFSELPTVGLILAAIYYLAAQLGGRLSAIVCGITFATMFAFAHLMPAGNYNFICPYEYEYTHATLLSFGCLIFLWRFLKNGRMVNSAIAGFLAGMVFLTRAEFFVAIAGASAMGFLLMGLQNARKSAGGIVLFLVMACVPAIISAAALATGMPMAMAIRGTLGMWPAVFRGNVAAQHFYQHSMGLDDLPRSLELLALWACGYAAAIGVFILASKLKLRRGSASDWAVFSAAAFGFLTIVVLYRQIDWISFFRPLPLVMAVICAAALFARRRTGNDAASLGAMAAIFSLLLLGKIFFYSRIVHYGVWLAMPATMLLLIAVFGWIPQMLARRGMWPGIYLAGIGAMWGSVIGVHLLITAASLARQNVSVGTGGDQFFTDSRGRFVDQAVTWARQNVAADQTLLCAPEGIMINYLARRRTATAYVNFNPPDLLLFGQANMLLAIQKSPPDLVMIVHKDTSEFGARFFGQDYGQAIGGWIAGNYRETGLIGSEPLSDFHMGIRLMGPIAAHGTSPSSAAESTSSRR